MTLKYYFSNSATPYTPATKRGAWDDSAATVIQLLNTVSSGAAATSGVAETSSSGVWDVLLGRWVSNALTADITFDVGSWTWQSVIGFLESNSAADMVQHIHIYVTTGDSDTVRGTLVSDVLGAPLSSEELPTTAAGQLFNNSTTNALTATVAAKAGDRIVVEIGYQAQNTSTVSRTGTMDYGNTGTDLTDGSTSTTTLAGWIEFKNNMSFNNYLFVKSTLANLGIISVTEKTR